MRRCRLTLVSAATVALAVLALAGCGSAPDPARAAPLARGGTVIRGTAAVEPRVSSAPYATGDLRFGLALLDASCKASPDSNLVFSPESLATGLGMAYLGARGATAKSMAGVLHLPAGAGAS